MSCGPWNQQEEIKLAEFLVASILEKSSGRSDQECLRNYPRDVYFIGNLRPRPDESSDPIMQSQHLREMMIKLAPVAFGAEFLLRTKNEIIETDITVHWACYYRVFPTFAQQCEHQNQSKTSVNTNSDASITSDGNLSRDTEARIHPVMR